MDSNGTAATANNLHKFTAPYPDTDIMGSSTKSMCSKRCLIWVVVVLVLVTVALAACLGVFIQRDISVGSVESLLKEEILVDQQQQQQQQDLQALLDGVDELRQSVDQLTQNEAQGPSEGNSGHYRYAAVSTGSDMCSTIGSDIMLRHGGSAVDAAIASLFCLGATVHSHLMGIGGGFLATILARKKNSSEKEVRALIAREVAPLAAEVDMFVNSSTASASVAVPGEVRGYYEMWQEYGQLPWCHLVQPTIDLCVDGYTVDEYQHKWITIRLEKIQRSDNLKALYLNADGLPLAKGSIIKQPALARALEAIRDDAMSFYTGPLASDIVADIQECDGGSIITLEDLKNVTVKWKEPSVASLHHGGYTMYSPPPPSSGVVVQLILKILDGYEIEAADLGREEKRSVLYHRVVEAFKHAFGQRSYLGDEDYVDVKERVSRMVSDDFARITQALINDSHTEPLEHYGSTFTEAQSPESSTNHIAVVAPDGTAVSLTSTINFHYGSGCMGTRTGIIFNNQMDDFSTPGLVNGFGFSPSASNYISPGKRPMSSMSPSIILDDNEEIVLVTGASGGSRIITATAQNIVDLLWLGKTVDQSNETPRLHHQLLPDMLMYEPDLDQNRVSEMKGFGHEVKSFSGRSSNVNNVFRKCPPGKLGHDIRQRTHCLSSSGDKGYMSSGKPDGA